MLWSVGDKSTKTESESVNGPWPTSSPAHKSFKSVAPSVLLFPKSNYKPGESGCWGLGSLQYTASTPTRGGIKRWGCPSNAPTHLSAPKSFPRNIRLTPGFQHHRTLGFSPRQIKLVHLIRTKKRMLPLSCIITFIMHTNAHSLKHVWTHYLLLRQRFKTMTMVSFLSAAWWNPNPRNSPLHVPCKTHMSPGATVSLFSMYVWLCA